MRSNTCLKGLYYLLFAVALSSCKKFVEIAPPVDQLNVNEVFADDKTATAAIVGIYSDMEFSLPVSTYLTLLPGLSADELVYTSNDKNYLQLADNACSPDNQYTGAVWAIYSTIYEANSCIEGIQKSRQLLPDTKNQLLGEALFSRAFCYFYLVNLFGDAPLVTATDYRINDTLSRTPSPKIYQQIIADLTRAQTLLHSDYRTPERVRPNSWTATALLARVYLYTNRWAEAESQASLVINSGLYTLSGLDSVFLNFSNETIWQLMPVNPSINTLEAITFIPGSPQQIPAFPLTNDLVNAFEPGDNRLTAWTGNTDIGGQAFYYPYKYKNGGGASLTEYHVVFRLAELYLIRAEARMHQNNISEALGDLDIIRSRAGLAPLSSSLTPDEAAAALQRERRIELFAEFGHRWLDLKRTARADLVIGALKPATWQTTDAFWPVPQAQRIANPFLTQNKGY
jgi:hypothetical protein